MSEHVFTKFSTVIPREWIDYNGHMNEAYYSHVLVDANEAFLDHLDLGRDYQSVTGRGLYTVESHLHFLKECREGEEIQARSHVEEAGEKVLRVSTTLRNGAGQDVLRASSVYLHVGPTGVVPFPQERLGPLMERAIPSPGS